MMGLAKESNVAIVGAGNRGLTIAQIAATAGHNVLLFDSVAGSAERGIRHIVANIDKLIARGRMPAEQRDFIVSRLHVVKHSHQLAQAALVIEAIPEQLALKQEALRQLEAGLDSQTIIATTTPLLSINALGSVLRHPERFLGLHFFNPVIGSRLVEVVNGIVTAPEVAQVVYATINDWGKQAVQTRSTAGFMIQRAMQPFFAESLGLLQEGVADVATLDTLLKGSGFKFGPFELMDALGNDVVYGIAQQLQAVYGAQARIMPSPLQGELVDAGHWGRKTGRGFYPYAPDTPKPAPTLAPKCAKPETITVLGDAPFAAGILSLLEKAKIPFERDKGANNDDFVVLAGEAVLGLTDGRLALQSALEDQAEDLVLFDWSLDYEKCTHIGIAPAEQASPKAIENAIGFWQALGKQVIVLRDSPGLCVMRTLCMLTNQAVEVMSQQVASADDIDLAFQQGLMLPQGILKWSQELGLARVITLLDNMASAYGQERFKPTLLLIKQGIANRPWFNA
ncbi:3-hydroxyacyl-CoA dehydrogenase NAD-binding domain-containing protein [Thiolinea disciformis]|uniref:3-hydroxyacyl-CoA dehydrogenase NAD-binding domain-containing protein n=1 Tax=Thiolinea disciformis TaxID=125614 RepID=UPI00037F4DF5|nr:3-hydroxyacyl-CoA dehydrogenase NAD-binding domain-containing protein [Thiolinea disciformis]